MLQKKHLINNEIIQKHISVIDDIGNNLGQMHINDALKIAQEKKMDLVQLSLDKNNNPICKIMNYHKYLYDLSKKEQLNKKNQKISELKEIWISPNIGSNDLEIKLNQIKKFLKDGNKIKISLRMHGRELAYTNNNIENMTKLYESIQDIATLESQPAKNLKSICMVIAPKKYTKN